uniref:Uncharacterized protein n=1 Tax=Anguilla anguilla TaxID=7936 RepID=A0A0E9V4V6_ANGAN
MKTHRYIWCRMTSQQTRVPVV